MPTDIIATEGLTEVRKFEEVEVEEPWCPTFRISQMDVEVYDMWARETSTGRNFDHFEIAF